MDDMAQGALGITTIMRIARDHMGVIIAAYYFDVSVGMTFTGKISTAIQGIEYAH